MAVIATGPRNHYWEYFLVLEDDLFKATRYVEFTPAHYDVYSIEFAHILFAAASEVDTILKALCNHLDTTKKHEGIDSYKTTILKAQPEFHKYEVAVPRIGLILHPWDEWSKPRRPNPFWWKSYNKVKHQRNTHFSQATLQNSLNSVAGLYCCLQSYSTFVDKLDIRSSVPGPKYLEIA